MTYAEGHVQAFAYFGGVPSLILYDNTKLAVARILGDGTRQKTRAFSELQSYYLFAEKFGRPAKGNDKGKSLAPREPVADFTSEPLHPLNPPDSNRQFRRKPAALRRLVCQSPASTINSHLSAVPREKHDPERLADKEALIDFLALITTRESARLSRCLRCQKFYLARRKKSKMFYCSKRCGTATTAAQSMQKSRDSEKLEKINQIGKVLEKNQPSADAIRAFETFKLPIKKNFVTRVLRARKFKGDLAVKLKRLRTIMDDPTRTVP